MTADIGAIAYEALAAMDACPVKPGETWSTSISGIPLASLSVRFG
jgi:hypothetical protein